MSMAEDDYRQMAIDESEAGEYADILAKASTLWTMFPSKTLYLRYLYLKRSLLNHILAKKRTAYNTAAPGGDRRDKRQQFENVNTMLALVERELSIQDPEYVPIGAGTPVLGSGVMSPGHFRR